MFRIFSRRDKKPKSKKQRNAHTNNASSSMNVARAPAIPSQRQMAEDMMKKMPPPPDFMKTLNDIVYLKDFSEIRVDILRLIRRVEIIKRLPGETEEKIMLGSLDAPDSIKEGPKHGVFLFMRLMEELVTYFEEEEVAQQQVDKMTGLYNDYLRKKERVKNAIPDEAKTEDEQEDGKTHGLLEDSPEALQHSEKVVDISHLVDHIPDEEEEENEDSGEFTVKNLVEIAGGDKTRAGIAVRCMCQGVAVSGHIQVKTRVCPLPTNDFHGERGWRLSITLAEFVQFKHIRRENSVNLMPNTAHNKWEIEFAVHLTFDKSMKEIAAAKLSIVDLLLSETMDADFAAYLKEKFNNGKLVVC